MKNEIQYNTTETRRVFGYDIKLNNRISSNTASDVPITAFFGIPFLLITAILAGAEEFLARLSNSLDAAYIALFSIAKDASKNISSNI